MPSDSYQIKYFEALQRHLQVGPPVYFVVKDGYDYTDLDSLRRLCGLSTCYSNSLQSLISSASMHPETTYIAQSSVNWIDDYMDWVNADPSIHTCCYVKKNTTDFCDYKKLSEEKGEEEAYRTCETCRIPRRNYNFPTKQAFLDNVQSFLKQNPSKDCIKAGHAMYGDAVKLIPVLDPKNLEEKKLPDYADKRYAEVMKAKLLQRHASVRVGPSHFMAYHSVLSTSDDFVNAMLAAQQIADLITKMLNENHNETFATDITTTTGHHNHQHKPHQRYEVFPYSIFYVFYEQYVKIWQDATMQLISTLFAIFICTFILLSFDLYTSLIVTVLIAIIIIDMVGIMYLWNIELNAISLVNLVIVSLIFICYRLSLNGFEN